MKFLSLIGVIVAIYSPLVFGGNENKLKLTNAKPIYASEEYFDLKTFKLEVVKENETYSHILTDFDVIKDLPTNTQYEVVVYRSKSGCQNYEKLNTYTASFCTQDNDQYDAYLSNIVRTLKESGKCVPKGHYHFDDTGFFAFSELLSDKELKDACFKAVSSLKSDGKSYYSVQGEFVSK